MPVNSVAKAWSKWTGGLVEFAKKLDNEGIEYLSFSKIYSLEACPQRYYLEYIAREELSPEPKYFVKGRVLHEAAAELHQSVHSKNHFPLDLILKTIARKLDAEDANHVCNAVTLMHRQMDDEWDVVAVEEPFVLDLGPDLPPCLGIIDLILRRDNEYRIVDHKGVRRFIKPDRLQLLLYREYVRRVYKTEQCNAHFDQYRWVNNLDRIRKPATSRIGLQVRDGSWAAALRRIRTRHNLMKKIEKTHEAADTGECITCPFKNQCPKASVSFSGSRW